MTKASLLVFRVIFFLLQMTATILIRKSKWNIKSFDFCRHEVATKTFFFRIHGHTGTGGDVACVKDIFLTVDNKII